MLNQTLPHNQEMTPVLLVFGELNVNSAIFGWLPGGSSSNRIPGALSEIV
jgi:hypothetical protein